MIYISQPPSAARPAPDNALAPIGRAIILAAAVLVSSLPAFGAAAEELLVVQKDRAYLPATLTAHVGDRVVFANEDDVTHNVYSESPAASFDLGAQKPGQKLGILLEKRGTVEVECEIHPKMHMVIEVK